jgi:hypothetical protein
VRAPAPLMRQRRHFRFLRHFLIFAFAISHYFSIFSPFFDFHASRAFSDIFHLRLSESFRCFANITATPALSFAFSSFDFRRGYAASDELPC